MSDLISRQDAIDTIGNVPDYDDGIVWEALSHAQRDVALLPSAQSEQQWIPVTERLPEEYGRYLVRYLVTLVDEGYRSVMPLYYGRVGRINTFYDSDIEYGDIEYCGVIAWMPLPEPYKGGEGK